MQIKRISCANVCIPARFSSMYIIKVPNYCMWFKYGLKAQKLLAQGVWGLLAKPEIINIKKLENIWQSRFLLRNLRCVKSAMNVCIMDDNKIWQD